MIVFLLAWRLLKSVLPPAIDRGSTTSISATAADTATTTKPTEVPLSFPRFSRLLCARTARTNEMAELVADRTIVVVALLKQSVTPGFRGSATPQAMSKAWCRACQIRGNMHEGKKVGLAHIRAKCCFRANFVNPALPYK